MSKKPYRINGKDVVVKAENAVYDGDISGVDNAQDAIDALNDSISDIDDRVADLESAEPSGGGGDVSLTLTSRNLATESWHNENGAYYNIAVKPNTCYCYRTYDGMPLYPAVAMHSSATNFSSSTRIGYATQYRAGDSAFFIKTPSNCLGLSFTLPVTMPQGFSFGVYEGTVAPKDVPAYSKTLVEGVGGKEIYRGTDKPLEDKFMLPINLCILGSSSATPSQGLWPILFQRKFNCKSVINLSQGGARWAHYPETTKPSADVAAGDINKNTMTNQVNALIKSIKSGSVVEPDVVLFLSGNNDRHEWDTDPRAEADLSMYGQVIDLDAGKLELTLTYGSVTKTAVAHLTANGHYAIAGFSFTRTDMTSANGANSAALSIVCASGTTATMSAVKAVVSTYNGSSYANTTVVDATPSDVSSYSSSSLDLTNAYRLTIAIKVNATQPSATPAGTFGLFRDTETNAANYSKSDHVLYDSKGNLLDFAHAYEDGSSATAGNGVFTTYSDDRLLTMTGGMRMAVETLWAEYPAIKVVFVTPLMGGADWWYKAQHIATKTKEVAKYLSVPVIDLTCESQLSAFRYNWCSSDRLHPDMRGALYMAECIGQGLLRHFSVAPYYKYDRTLTVNVTSGGSPVSDYGIDLMSDEVRITTLEGNPIKSAENVAWKGKKTDANGQVTGSIPGVMYTVLRGSTKKGYANMEDGDVTLDINL